VFGAWISKKTSLKSDLEETLQPVPKKETSREFEQNAVAVVVAGGLTVLSSLGVLTGVINWVFALPALFYSVLFMGYFLAGGLVWLKGPGEESKFWRTFSNVILGSKENVVFSGATDFGNYREVKIHQGWIKKSKDPLFNLMRLFLLPLILWNAVFRRSGISIPMIYFSMPVTLLMSYLSISLAILSILFFPTLGWDGLLFFRPLTKIAYAAPGITTPTLIRILGEQFLSLEILTPYPVRERLSKILKNSNQGEADQILLIIKRGLQSNRKEVIDGSLSLIYELTKNHPSLISEELIDYIYGSWARLPGNYIRNVLSSLEFIAVQGNVPLSISQYSLRRWIDIVESLDEDGYGYIEWASERPVVMDLSVVDRLIQSGSDNARSILDKISLHQDFDPSVVNVATEFVAKKFSGLDRNPLEVLAAVRKAMEKNPVLTLNELELIQVAFLKGSVEASSEAGPALVNLEKVGNGKINRQAYDFLVETARAKEIGLQARAGQFLALVYKNSGSVDARYLNVPSEILNPITTAALADDSVYFSREWFKYLADRNKEDPIDKELKRRIITTLDLGFDHVDLVVSFLGTDPDLEDDVIAAMKQYKPRFRSSLFMKIFLRGPVVRESKLLQTFVRNFSPDFEQHLDWFVSKQGQLSDEMKADLLSGYDTSVTQFFVGEKNDLMIREKGVLVDLLRRLNIGSGALRYILGTVGSIGENPLASIRSLTNLLSAAQIFEKDEESWKIILEQYVPDLGYLADADMISVYLALVRGESLSSQSLEKYDLGSLGIREEMAPKERIRILVASLKKVTISLFKNKDIDETILKNSLIAAYVGKITGFNTSVWGHGTRRGFKLADFVRLQRDQARTNAPLDKDLHEEGLFEVNRIGRIDFTPDEIQMFERYKENVEQIHQWMEDASIGVLSRIQSAVKLVIGEEIEALTRRLEGQESSRAKEFITQQRGKYVNLLSLISNQKSVLGVVLIIIKNVPKLAEKNHLLKNTIIQGLLYEGFQINPDYRHSLLNELSEPFTLSTSNMLLDFKHAVLGHPQKNDAESQAHVLSDVNQKEADLIHRIFTTRIFEEAQDRIKTVAQPTMVRAFMTKGILGEMAGDIGDACYTAVQNIMGYKSMVGAVLFTTGKEVEEKFAGSLVILENSIDGEKVWILRAINPTQGFLNEYDAKGFVQGAVAYVEKLARKKDIRYLVSPNGVPGALTNRSLVQSVMGSFSKKADVELDQAENFNGYSLKTKSHVIVDLGTVSVKVKETDKVPFLGFFEKLRLAIRGPRARPELAFSGKSSASTLNAVILPFLPLLAVVMGLDDVTKYVLYGIAFLSLFTNKKFREYFFTVLLFGLVGGAGALTIGWLGHSNLYVDLVGFALIFGFMAMSRWGRSLGVALSGLSVFAWVNFKIHQGLGEDAFIGSIIFLSALVSLFLFPIIYSVPISLQFNTAIYAGQPDRISQKTVRTLLLGGLFVLGALIPSMSVTHLVVLSVLGTLFVFALIISMTQSLQSNEPVETATEKTTKSDEHFTDSNEKVVDELFRKEGPREAILNELLTQVLIRLSKEDPDHEAARKQFKNIVIEIQAR